MNEFDEEHRRWTSCLYPSRKLREEKTFLIGVLVGEGVGEEVINCAVEVLDAITRSTDLQFDIRYGGAIGRESEKSGGEPLSDEVIDFCNEVFHQSGSILCGPGGGRFVYDLRRQFDLFFKISPIQVANGFPNSSRLKPNALQDVDILVTREGRSGVYQGAWKEQFDEQQRRVSSQVISYDDIQVQRFLDASAKLAASRQANMTVVWKESGVPTISSLWRDCAERAAAENGIEYRMVDVDLMAYQLIQDANMFNVIATPNLFGDVIADLGAVLLGSRGVSYSGNYSEQGWSVYQTNHGAAYDLAGKGIANPIGQILALAMMLRESFELDWAANCIHHAVRKVRDLGFVTAELSGNQNSVLGTQEIGSLIAKHVAESIDTQANT